MYCTVQYGTIRNKSQVPDAGDVDMQEVEAKGLFGQLRKDHDYHDDVPHLAVRVAQFLDAVVYDDNSELKGRLGEHRNRYLLWGGVEARGG